MTDTAPQPRLLYVDDDPEQRLLVRLALERLGGWQMTLAGSQEDLPAVARQSGAGFVLLATTADTAPTERALASLRADAGCRALPVVVLAVHAPPAAAAHWQGLGAVDAITGALVPSTLPARLRTLHMPRPAEPEADPIADLRRSFLAQLPQRRQTLRRRWQAAVGGESAAIDEVRLVAHRLAGTGATFGQDEIGRLARQLEQAVLAWRAVPATETRAAVEAALADFEMAVDAVSDPSAATAVPATETPAKPPQPAPTAAEAGDGSVATALWVVGIAPMLQSTLPPLGERLRSHADLDAALAALVAGEAPPAATLIGTAMLGRPDAIARLRAHAPLALYSGRGSLADRIAGVHAGAETCFAATVDQAALGEWLEMRCAPRVGDALRVLLVDDDPMFVALCSNLLASAGFVVRALEHPYSLCEVLSDFEPDVLLLDVYLRDCTGIEVATALRQFPGWAQLPIVFLSADQELARQAAALGTGLDDWLAKPFEAMQLRQVVQTRALRGRRLRIRVETDPLTGALSQAGFRERFGIEVGRAHRYGRALALALIDADGLERLDATQGRGASERVLRLLAQRIGQRVRRSDLLGRSGNTSFALALPETGGDVAAFVIETLRSAWQQNAARETQLPGPLSLSAGVAALQPGETAASLQERALRALRIVRHGGGNRLLRIDEAADQAAVGGEPASPNTTSAGRGSLM